MNQLQVVRAEVDSFTKASAESLLGALGLLPDQAIRLFYQEIIARHGLPFEPDELAKDQAVAIGLKNPAYQDIHASSIPSVLAETWGPPGRGTQMLNLLHAYQQKRAEKKAGKAGKKKGATA